MFKGIWFSTMNHRNKEAFNLKLWERIKANGDQSAFDAFYVAYASLLFKYGYSLVQDEDLIYDCIQELFLEIWLKREKIQFTSSPKNYLLIALRRLIFKKKSKINFVDLDSIPPVPAETKTEDSTIFHQKLKAVKANIEKLPRRQKEAMYLKYMEHMDYEEVASIMDISIPSVYKAVSAAIKKLRSIRFLGF